MNMRVDNKRILQDTLEILEQGYYVVDGKKKMLKLTKQQMEHCMVYLPDDIEKISQSKDFSHVHMFGRIGCSVENMDSFSLARKRYDDCSYMFSKDKDPRILVLNLANPVNPGGGVRRGAKAQEEDLCRKSSLLVSLEGAEAHKYYAYNRGLNTYMGSDAVIITPDVEIIKDEDGNLLEESVIVSVMTCAAPIMLYGMEGLSDDQYQAMVYKRITGMLKIAAYLKYEMLVLGAFGCGAFGNDAHVVSDLFYKAIKEFDYDGMQAEDFFRRIDFAVLCRSNISYNFKEFARNFHDFYRDEDQKERNHAMEAIKATEIHLDQIRGSMIGGAIGDALGYAVEFLREDQIFRTYGSKGITEYDLVNGKAIISDDTQMTLFTANGLLVGDTRGRVRGIMGASHRYVADAYHDWYLTQTSSFEETKSHERYTKARGQSWLLDVPELYAWRAPGNTCMSALASGAEDREDYIKDPLNNSKGCGGIMRVAPLALKYREGVNYSGNIRALDKEGAQIAAITHGHSLGYMPAAVVTHIIQRCLTEKNNVSLREIVIDAKNTVAEIFAGDKHLPELTGILDLAVELSENDSSDLENIHKLGEGWVAEETLGIAVYCALKYQNDFSKAIIVSVNHNGDSDSTGAVTGNILGALVGYDAIEQKWKDNLELHDVILEMADDLCHGCQMSAYSHYTDPAWITKYINMHRYEGNGSV
jgi:uncharacterized protein (TIGR02452 family)